MVFAGFLWFFKVVSWFFMVKKNLLLNEIIKGGVFGRIVGYISVVD